MEREREREKYTQKRNRELDTCMNGKCIEKRVRKDV